MFVKFLSTSLFPFYLIILSVAPIDLLGLVTEYFSRAIWLVSFIDDCTCDMDIPYESMMLPRIQKIV